MLNDKEDFTIPSNKSLRKTFQPSDETLVTDDLKGAPSSSKDPFVPSCRDVAKTATRPVNLN